MSSYDSLGDLLEVLDREVQLLLNEQDNGRLLIELPRLVELLYSDARLSSGLSEICEAVWKREKEFDQHDTETLGKIRALWHKHRSVFRKLHKAAKSGKQEGPFGVHGLYSHFESTLVELPNIHFPLDEEIGDDPSRSGKCLKMLTHWISWSNSSDKMVPVQEAIDVLSENHTYEFRRFWFDGRNLAGLAFERLNARILSLNAAPSRDRSDLGRMLSLVKADQSKALVGEVFGSGNASQSDRIQIQDAVAGIRQDIRLLHHGIRSSLLLRRSHLGLIKRFAARCERFEASELRRMAHSDGETALTLRFARFLFDAGMDPFVDPTIANLRPDLFDPRTGIYVEAKQYSGRQTPNAVIRNIAQVVDTWGRMRSTHRLSEAFLAIFRLGGRRIELPEVVHVLGRKLFSVVVDIGKSKGAGSKQKERPLVIDEKSIVELFQARTS